MTESNTITDVKHRNVYKFKTSKIINYKISIKTHKIKFKIKIKFLFNLKFKNFFFNLLTQKIYVLGGSSICFTRTFSEGRFSEITLNFFTSIKLGLNKIIFTRLY